MQDQKNNYFKSWREQHPNYWNYHQLRWYHREKKKFLLGQKKLNDNEFEEFNDYEEEKIAREIQRLILKIDKLSQGWSFVLN